MNSIGKNWPRTREARGMLCVEPTLAEPFQGERMARREHQMPSVLRQKGPQPYWYIRYRERVYNQETKRFYKEERWYRIGYCNEMTKREAERVRDQVMAK